MFAAALFSLRNLGRPPAELWSVFSADLHRVNGSYPCEQETAWIVSVNRVRKLTFSVIVKFSELLQVFSPLNSDILIYLCRWGLSLKYVYPRGGGSEWQMMPLQEVLGSRRKTGC